MGEGEENRGKMKETIDIEEIQLENKEREREA